MSNSGRGLPPGVHRKTAKGRTYYYFDTGIKKDGKTILKRLPELRSPEFGPAYASALQAKSHRNPSLVEVITVREMAKRYERSAEFAKLADNSQRSYRHYLKAIDANLGMAPVDRVTRVDVLRLLDKLADRPAAANTTLAVINALYTWGRRRGLATVEPGKDILENDSTDYEPWPDELIEAALACDDPVIRTSVALLYFTAQRIGDVCKMRWSDIRNGVLYLKQQKTGTSLEIPVHARLLPLLGTPAGMTILVKDGKPFTPAAIRGRLQKWAAAQGYKIVPHGLRKSAVNAILEVGSTAAETGAISGQSLQLVEHYAKRRDRGKLAGAAIVKWQNRP